MSEDRTHDRTAATEESQSAVSALAVAVLGVINTSPVGQRLRDTTLGADVVHGKAQLSVVMTLPAGPVQIFLTKPGKPPEELDRLEIPPLRGLDS